MSLCRFRIRSGTPSRATLTTRSIIPLREISFRAENPLARAYNGSIPMPLGQPRAPSAIWLETNTTVPVNGDGTVRDTIGDFNGAPGIGPGEAFNMQLAAKIIF